MLATLIVGLLHVTMPWDPPPPPPEGAKLVLTQPPFPDPPPEGSVIDVPGERELPANWRSSTRANPKTKGNAGLDALMASGSGQFCRDQLYAVQQELRGRRVAVIDLREEPHTFLNGAAISWGPPALGGDDRRAPAVERIERAWTKRLVDAKFTTATEYAPGIFANEKTWEPIALKLDVRDAGVESHLVAEARWGYFRIAAPDTIVPRDRDVDRLIALVRGLDEGLWLHFHCDTGGNRTTLFLTLYDMMRNYARASRPEIIARQRRLGGIDLLAGPGKAGRADFLARFFDYCWQCGPHFRRSWSSWSRKNAAR
ncbi:MAG: hypothetical protein PHC88_01005 [Terrimicrobiaceae bacterium]|nr:hypothetical protein [Terrimicrobiaceae bacterium]